jgi:hypothetical protein
LILVREAAAPLSAPCASVMRWHWRLTGCVAPACADWSNAKGTGTADGWAKHRPMDDEEMLFKQVQMTAAATKGTTIWIYRNTVYRLRKIVIRTGILN